MYEQQLNKFFQFVWVRDKNQGEAIIYSIYRTIYCIKIGLKLYTNSMEVFSLNDTKKNTN